MAISRTGVLLTLLLVGSVCIIAAPQQTPAAPPAGRGVASNFTGTVRSVDAANVRAVRFQYDAGARSYWHSHEGSQILLLEEGRGRMQIQGQGVQELVPGQPAFLPGGVPHWHGAAPDQGLTQIAVNVGGRCVLVLLPRLEGRVDRCAVVLPAISRSMKCFPFVAALQQAYNPRRSPRGTQRSQSR